MDNKNPTPSVPTWILPAAFGLSLLYWLYLAFVSQMIMINDALGYEGLARLIYEKGWLEYFKTGPNREPLYPFLISLSMRLSDLFSINYQDIQKMIQIILLFLTQLLTLQILKKLHINTFLTALVILYIGFSPALVNSSLCLFSEVAVFPLLPAIILMTAQSWIGLLKGKDKAPLDALALGLLFLAVTFIKNIFEALAPLFLIPFILLAARFFLRKEKILFQKSLIFLITFSLTFFVPVFLYKLANKKYNENFTFTDRGAWALYGNTARRMEPMNTERILTSLAFVPYENVCFHWFGREKCEFWSYGVSDQMGYEKKREFEGQKLSDEEINQGLIRASVQKILSNPFQYLFFFEVESLKNFFWESTRLGHVAYPNWLDKIYRSALFSYGLSFLMALLSLAAFVKSMIFTWHNRIKIFYSERIDESGVILFYTALLIALFIFMYSFFLILPRYPVMIAPLFLILIAFFIKKT